MSEAFIEWVDDGVGRLPVFFDRRLHLVDALHDYAASVASTKRLSSGLGYAATLDAASYALLGWLRYLDGRGLQWQQANDMLLGGFREAELVIVQRSVHSIGQERVAKRTVNVKLQWIYRFYCWAQERAGLCSGIIGPNGAINSTITDSNQRERRGRPTHGMFPCCYPGIAGSQGGLQYFATDEDKQSILAYFSKTQDPFLRERNSLMLELSDRVGWRAGTVNGLLVDDFNAGAIERASDDGVMVIPEVQKRGYRNAFEVDHSLAARVVRFIAMRKRWLARRGWGESQGKGRLFVSVRTGKPLGNKTLVQILGTAFRAVGVPAKRGAGHHSFRRKYSDQSTREDLQARKITGHSVAVEDVLHAAARRLGQRKIASQGPYQRAVQDGTRSAEPHRLRRQVQELESAVASKEARIAELERALMPKAGDQESKRKRQTR